MTKYIVEEDRGNGRSTRWWYDTRGEAERALRELNREAQPFWLLGSV